ncbi:zinc-dependent alcohol dehydrogenase [Methylomonas koyamae]|uniref:Oxidoreductase n=1 Tax=Methylomonas koyamae TaxID=702114 RepID=A0A291IHQ7_9GAMM|nr:zinc-binding alcohol dehydrogenase [Methylomonas koyamae]ATG89842.1 hypothetical protein MKLM6_1598 [Methylomonas koyamae]OAI21918.1 oxidoreductase [Methylomonas koyamae]
MLAQQLWFSQPFEVHIRETQLPAPAAGQVVVKTLCSAVSAGSELLVYRGQLPPGIDLDATLKSLQHAPTYPLPYGYACVGRVEQLGDGVDPAWLDTLVFSFQPHASRFIATPDQLLAVPDGIEPEAAVFLANAETAVSLVHDGAPLLGERVVVLGQGVVGLLLTGLLARFPLDQLFTVDAFALRREWSISLKATAAFDATAAGQIAQLKIILTETDTNGADLLYEVSGQPHALNQAIDLCGFTSRIVVGSWYGDKSAPIALGGAAHRNRIRFTTSQVSSIDPVLSGRWDKTRRFTAAWRAIRQLSPQQWITHRYPLAQAGELYRRLDQTPESVLQALLVY